MIKLTKPGILALILLVGTVGALVGQSLLPHHHSPQSQNRKIVWEHLDGENGANLQRLETPLGWLIQEDTDSYLVYILDPDKEWLKDED